MSEIQKDVIVLYVYSYKSVVEFTKSLREKQVPGCNSQVWMHMPGCRGS